MFDRKKLYKWFIHICYIVKHARVCFINVVTWVVWYHSKKISSLIKTIDLYAMCNNNPYLAVLIIGGSQRILHPDLSHSPFYPLFCKVYREEVQALRECYWTNTTESSHLILFLEKIPERNCYELAVLEPRNWVFCLL